MSRKLVDRHGRPTSFGSMVLKARTWAQGRRSAGLATDWRDIGARFSWAPLDAQDVARAIETADPPKIQKSFPEKLPGRPFDLEKTRRDGPHEILDLGGANSLVNPRGPSADPANREKRTRNMSTSMQLLRPLGAQALPARWIDLMDLARACDGDLVSPQVLPFAGRGVRPVQGAGPSLQVRDALPVAVAYRLVSMVISGRLSAKVGIQLALEQRAADPVRRLPEAWAAAMLETIREWIAATAPVAPAFSSGHAPGDYGLAQAYKNAARAHEDLIEGVPQTLDAVAKDMVAAGLGAGAEYEQAIYILNHLTAGMNIGDAQGRSVFRAKVDAASRSKAGIEIYVHGMKEGSGYAEGLLVRAGVPVTQQELRKLPREVQDAWQRDPSFAPVLHRTHEPANITEAVAAIEARIDAELGSAL